MTLKDIKESISIAFEKDCEPIFTNKRGWWCVVKFNDGKYEVYGPTPWLEDGDEFAPWFVSDDINEVGRQIKKGANYKDIRRNLPTGLITEKDLDARRK